MNIPHTYTRTESTLHNRNWAEQNGKAGIYEIVYLPRRWSYVGASVNCHRRMLDHVTNDQYLALSFHVASHLIDRVKVLLTLELHGELYCRPNENRRDITAKRFKTSSKLADLFTHGKNKLIDGKGEVIQLVNTLIAPSHFESKIIWEAPERYTNSPISRGQLASLLSDKEEELTVDRAFPFRGMLNAHRRPYGSR